jgi:hypothetical protein
MRFAEDSRPLSALILYALQCQAAQVELVDWQAEAIGSGTSGERLTGLLALRAPPIAERAGESSTKKVAHKLVSCAAARARERLPLNRELGYADPNASKMEVPAGGHIPRVSAMGCLPVVEDGRSIFKNGFRAKGDRSCQLMKRLMGQSGSSIFVTQPSSRKASSNSTTSMWRPRSTASAETLRDDAAHGCRP